MNKKHFTLIELLVVIGIIAILSAILLPVLSGAAKKADMSKARSEIATLVNAIKQYESVYGVLPVPASTSGEELDSAATPDQFKELIYILQADTTNIHAGNQNKNSRRQKFLDIVGNEAGFYKDPWDNDYIVLLDHNYDGKITTIPEGINLTSPVVDLSFSVVVWSMGPDGKSNSTTAHKENRDNIYSFPTLWTKADGHNISR
ncbi:type II secretion system protein [Oligosphaera ethanolica]|uniref:Prepilin-type N-terminal cleavage/methylation domain-containing protein n=1 Tax=Oligosphaera ethanolica TaxID=760260 RepID=A0AAE4AQ01_9BACT|nr:prepilin-type N-terminal cleavage/methylation domain-containing protein [Oligosphaera ethanolica]